MDRLSSKKLSAFAIAVSAMVLAFLALSAPAWAQSPDHRIALLNVPGGGTEILTEGLEQIQGVKVEDQDWFINEIQSRGISPRKILRRPKDLRWVIEGAEISYILYLRDDEEDEEKYLARFIGKNGEVERELPVDRSSKGLTETGARVIVDEARELLGAASADTPQVATLDEPEEGLQDPQELVERKRAEEEEVKDRLSRDWLFASVGARLLKRDLNLSGSNGAVLNYKSQFYPGAQIDLEAYPLAHSDPEAAGVGVYLTALMGFGSVKAAQDDPSVIVDNAVSHLEIEGGPTYRLVSPLGQEGGATMVKARIKAAMRYTSFSVDPNRALPSTSLISVVVGAAVSYPVFTPGFAIQGEFEVVPIGFWGTSSEFFGESSSTYGFGAGLGGLYAFSPSLGVQFGYKFRVDRSQFDGDGTLEFTDTQAFELVQGAHLALFYQY